MDANGTFLLMVPIPILITWFLLDLVRKLSIKFKLFAVPNERSSHDKITPITGIIMRKVFMPVLFCAHRTPCPKSLTQ